ncbi:xanthine dehydrogenase family protein molybdopterin-binding subunit [Puniceibacterium sp. IMCC21224]|uniref:xanthine dehydrogenase family protein molybdopterin-binding subunit n=1 Tax=Puniceibacterium sp. IMCC21224 TaxID=1618204 RepID=UPI00064DD699|nr:xanthine dehydrogenase family protein molybdopterin-binding subunit [Puniceibacterium sp. IMCC21224]KMK64545.1 aerobic-type carbon monoxide dehydrogenase, large subunit CoxL/CutL-like protein [Puniceibacterium sp. IMCC21224]
MTKFIGKPIPRIEDPRLLKGQGRYIDDITPPGTLHAAFLRSDVAHGRIDYIDVEPARNLPGVHAVLKMSDFAAYSKARMPQPAPIPAITAEVTTPYPLALDEVCFVGEPIAIILAESRAIAEDAVPLIDVEISQLPVVASLAAAKKCEAIVRDGAPTNLAGRFKTQYGDVESGFANATHEFLIQVKTHRGGGHSMEGRGVICQPGFEGHQLTLWTSTQIPHAVQRNLALYLGVAEADIRVAAPDVGGGFGPKGIVYPEEFAVALAALKLKQPVKWIEDRREHFLSCVQQRDQHWTAEIATDGKGVVEAVRLRGLNDCGAYLPYGLLLPMNTFFQFPGPYTWKALDIELEAYFTNLTPTSPVRGAGRPSANFVMERIMDEVALQLDLDPAEVRRRNLVASDMYPHQTGMKNPAGLPITHDSGSHNQCLDVLSEQLNISNFESRKADAAHEGRYLGQGIACYVEDSGIPPFEGATVRIEGTGKVIVETPAANQGQGHTTIFAQICAEVLGVDPTDVTVRSGDTQTLPYGIGTLGSRVAVTAGNSVYAAAKKVRAKTLRYAADMLACEPDSLHLRDKHVCALPGTDAPTEPIPLARIAMELRGVAGVPVRRGFSPGLEATEYATMIAPVFSNGAVGIEVEVDTALGAVELKRCVFVHDCGRMLNPLLVEGQIIGGAVHGIGNALFERMVHDEAGQPVSMNYGEYLMPMATEMPSFEITHLETPSPNNALGVKGAGESGTIPMASAVVAAVENALSAQGVRFFHHPITPQDIVAALRCDVPS